MEFTPQDLLLINDLINICWQSGAVKSPQMAQQIEMLRVKLQPKKDAKVIPGIEKRG